jgi:hypothetical protein
MAVINQYSAAVASIFAENAIASRQDKRVIRDADLARQIADVEKRMSMEQIASSQKQAELTLNIAQKGVSLAENGVALGKGVAELPEQMRVNDALQSGAANYQQDHGAQLLSTDLGGGRTVEDVLGTDQSGQPIADPAQRREVAQAKLDALMTGNFNSAEDLRAIGFSDAEANALMGLKDRGEGNELTTDEAVEFLFARSQVAGEQSAFDQARKIIDPLLQHGSSILSHGAKIGQKSAKDAARQFEEDRGDVGRNRATQSRMSWLSTEQMTQASEMVLNKKDQTYKP